MSGKPRGSGGPGRGDHQARVHPATGRAGAPTAVVRRGVHWLSGLGPDGDVVVSSRALARNLAGFPFLNRATRCSARACSIARERLFALAAGESPADAGRDPRLQQTALPATAVGRRSPCAAGPDAHGQRHLISKEHAAGRRLSAVRGIRHGLGTEDKSGGGYAHRRRRGGRPGNGGEDEPAREGKPTGAAGQERA